VPDRFTDPSALDLSQTLGQDLIDVADDLRDLFTEFGLRPYEVRVVRERWTGGRRGIGTPIVVREVHLLPTPRLASLEGLQNIVSSVGQVEEGNLLLSEISGRFTEDDLRGMVDDGAAIDEAEEFYFEVKFPARREGGVGAQRRRFYPASAPAYQADAFQWVVVLVRQRGDRRRNGDSP
jgi:hypothetical protein